MQRERFGLRIATDKRIFAQFTDGFVQDQWIGSNGVQMGARITYTLNQQLFGDTIRLEKSAEPQHVSRDSIVCSIFSKESAQVVATE